MAENSRNHHPQDANRRNDKGRTRNRGTSGAPRKHSAQKPAQRTRNADPARLTAFQVLQAVSVNDAYANLVLPKTIRANRLNKLDAGFATELTYGTLRWQGTYDRIIALSVDRPLHELDEAVLDVLRMGCHQLMQMRVPAHAALNSTVGLARQEIGAGPSGFVNAVLRKISENSFDEWLAEVEATATKDADDVLALQTSHPRWMIRALRQSLATHGRDVNELEAMLKANNVAPALNLVALPGIGNLDAVLEHGAEPGPLVADSAIFSGGDAGRIPGVPEGTVRVQDAGSQLSARSLLAARPVKSGETWLDMCAGPGGKAALLAALATQHDAHLVANEVSEHRTALVRDSLRVISDSVVSVRTGDGRTLAQDLPGQTFDRVLLDAPCTGMGALRRRPESRWRRTMSDLAVLTKLQKELLDAAVEVLAEDGLLAYVTCSPHHAETKLQVVEVLKRHPDMQLLDTASIVQQAARTDASGASVLDRASLTDSPAGDESSTAQLWPDVHATDAMFIAILKKAPVSGTVSP